MMSKKPSAEECLKQLGYCLGMNPESSYFEAYETVRIALVAAMATVDGSEAAKKSLLREWSKRHDHV